MMRKLINTVVASYHRFNGMGGRCGQAAIAINRVIFGNRGQIVGAFNRAFYESGRMTGHVAVFADGFYWDSDARPKALDEVESWGMLDLNDPDYASFADDNGIHWDDDTADDVIIVEMTEAEAIAAYGDDQLPKMMKHLGWSGLDQKV